jgi:hypothetical protein
MSSPGSPPLTASLTRRACVRLGAVVGGALLGCMLLAVPADAQAPPPPPPGGPPAAGTPIYSDAQLEQLLAPVALYPDDLLGQILMAATYPLEVVQADRWMQDSAHSSLRGTALAQALQEQPWDASVKSLTAYPQILAWMDSALDWTEAAGDAFLAQQPEVMDAVQRLRSRAQAAGTLSSTPQQTVTADNQGIEITSPDSGVEYVPVYDPQMVYGSWPYPDYPPYDFYLAGYPFGTYIAFPILAPYWGWDRPDWRHHRIDIDNGPGGPPGGGRPPMRPVPWHHDPTHRGGVPYRDPGTRARFEGPAGASATRGNYRGYSRAHPEAAPLNRPQQRPAALPPTAYRPPVAERPALEARQPMPAPRFEARQPTPAPRPAPQAAPRPMPPAVESFGRGPEVHVQEQRGMSSRTEPPSGGGRGHR